MNGYKLMAESHKALLDKSDSEVDREELKTKIRVHELLA